MNNPFILRLKVGEDVPVDDILGSVTRAIYERCVQYADECPQKPADSAFLTATENIEVIVRSWKDQH